MRVRIETGRLDERETPDNGMGRTAHGEFIGPRGELASYAVGWETEADPHAGWIAIGIGAGNPGGGTFHAYVVDDEQGGHFFSLTDDRLADVPQGGPHLTAAEARAHEDLPFVWAVADTVMDRDPRAWWMRHWLLGTVAITTTQVADGSEPVLLVCNEERTDTDAGWRLIGTTDGSAENGTILHLSHLVDQDPSLAEVLDLRAGAEARRPGIGRRWRRSGERGLLDRMRRRPS